MPMRKTVKQLVDEANAEIECVSAKDAIRLAHRDDVVVVDLRDIRERVKEGFVPDSVHAPRGMLEFWVDPDSPYYKDVFGGDDTFVFYCAGGWRSALATATVQDMGMERVAHVDGGFGAWRKLGGPIEKTVASWSGCVVERISQVNDDGQVEHVAALALRSAQQTVTLPVPSEVFGDDAALRRFIAGRAGEAAFLALQNQFVVAVNDTHARRILLRFIAGNLIGRVKLLHPAVTILVAACDSGNFGFIRLDQIARLLILFCQSSCNRQLIFGTPSQLLSLFKQRQGFFRLIR